MALSRQMIFLALVTMAAPTLGAAAPSITPANAFIDEIVVTARKREETLAHIPLTVSVLDRASIRAQEIDDIYDLAAFIPNFSMNPSNGRQAERPTIRGQSNILGAPNASFFIDGFYVNSESAMGAQTMGAIERIEVIKGPQAALFGRSTLSGAVNYVTRAPDPIPETTITAGIGSYSSHKFSLLVNQPLLSDRVLFLGEVGQVKTGGEWTNQLDSVSPSAVFPGAPDRSDHSRLGDQTTTNFMGKLKFSLDEVSWTLSAQELAVQDGLYPTYFLGASELNCFLPVVGTSTEKSRGYYCGEIEVANREISSNIPDIRDGLTFAGQPGAGADPGIQRKTQRYLSDLDVDVGDWVVTTKLSYSRDVHTLAEDSDHTGLRPSLYFFNGTVIRKHTQDQSVEIRAFLPQSQYVSAFFGGYYYEQRHLDQRRNFYGEYAKLGEPERIRNLAGFGSVDFHPTSSLSVTAEARYAEDRITLSDGTSRTFPSLTPRFAVLYDIGGENAFFANVALGTKPGGFNQDYFKSSTHSSALEEALKKGLAFVDEEKAWNYEVGVRHRSVNDRLGINLSVFFIDWTRQQLTSIAEIRQTNGTYKSVPIIVNLGESQITGLDFDLHYQPIDRLRLGISYGLADSEITKGNDPVDEFGLTGIDDSNFSQGGNLKGRQLPNAPRQSGVAYLEVSGTAWSDHSWTLRTDVLYESKKYAQVHNLVHTGERLTVNLHTTLDFGMSSLEFYGTNIFDDDTPLTITRYVDFVSPSGPNGLWRGFMITPQQGARYGLIFRRRF